MWLLVYMLIFNKLYIIDIATKKKKLKYTQTIVFNIFIMTQNIIY